MKTKSGKCESLFIKITVAYVRKSTYPEKIKIKAAMHITSKSNVTRCKLNRI